MEIHIFVGSTDIPRIRLKQKYIPTAYLIFTDNNIYEYYKYKLLL